MLSIIKIGFNYSTFQLKGNFWSLSCRLSSCFGLSLFFVLLPATSCHAIPILLPLIIRRKKSWDSFYTICYFFFFLWGTMREIRILLVSENGHRCITYNCMMIALVDFIIVYWSCLKNIYIFKGKILCEFVTNAVWQDGRSS